MLKIGFAKIWVELINLKILNFFNDIFRGDVFFIYETLMKLFTNVSWFC